jgi:predicted RNase H-like nuclease (RuvC/YqgF family)
MRLTVQGKCYSLSFRRVAHLPVHDKYDLNLQEIEKLKRERKKKDEEAKNLKKKFNAIQRHQQHFRTGSGEGVSSFFKVRHHLLILSVAN